MEKTKEFEETKDFYVIFNDFDKVHTSHIITRYMKQKQIEIWNEDFIENVKKFGTRACIDGQVFFICYYKVTYPNEMEEETIQKYLSCYMDRLTYNGGNHCNFKFKRYLTDLLSNAKPESAVSDLQIKMQLAKQVFTKRLFKKLPEFTSLSYDFIEQCHQEYCLKIGIDRCECEANLKECKKVFGNPPLKTN